MVSSLFSVKKEKALMVGDSIRRDLGGAKVAGIDCILVGKVKYHHAVKCYENLLELSYAV